jgi:hypothetical protein
LRRNTETPPFTWLEVLRPLVDARAMYRASEVTDQPVAAAITGREDVGVFGRVVAELLDVHRGLPQARRVPVTVVMGGVAAERDHAGGATLTGDVASTGRAWPWRLSWIRSWRAIAGQR